MEGGWKKQKARKRGATSTIDPVAMALALSGASREKADAFLDDCACFDGWLSAIIVIRFGRAMAQSSARIEPAIS